MDDDFKAKAKQVWHEMNADIVNVQPMGAQHPILDGIPSEKLLRHVLANQWLIGACCINNFKVPEEDYIMNLLIFNNEIIDEVLKRLKGE